MKRVIHPVFAASDGLNTKLNTRQGEYDNYLVNHITGVQRSWQEILRPQLIIHEDVPGDTLSLADEKIAMHDASKRDDREYIPYLNYFYPADGSEFDEAKVDDETDYAFDTAWLYHQNTNPHHWQYWMLVRDSGKTILMDMPIEYVFEMLCDWHSFSARDPQSTAFNWYDKNKDKMQLSPATRSIVEKYIVYLQDPLASGT